MGRRSDQLVAVAREFCRVHQDWQNDINQDVPGEPYWEAMEAVIESFSAGDIPSDCRALAAAVNRLAVEDDKFGRDMEATGVVYPHNEFWAARQSIEDCLSSAAGPQLRPLERIADLRMQQVPDAQIARIYGFVDRRGEPMPWLVQAELDNPGSITERPGAVDGRDWRDPRTADSMVAESAAEVHSNGISRRKPVEPAAEERIPCKESLSELWEQEVTPEQAAKMLCRPVEEVKAQFTELDQGAMAEIDQPEKRRRGRPRKVQSAV